MARTRSHNVLYTSSILCASSTASSRLHMVHTGKSQRMGLRASSLGHPQTYVACAVWPSCHRNSLVRRNGRVRISHRNTFAHWPHRKQE